MEMRRDADGAGPAIIGFSAAGYRLSVDGVERRVDGGLWLTPDTAEAWDAPPLATLDAAALAPLLARDPQPEFLLLGTGAAMVRPPRALVAALEGGGIGVEAMDSRAAARAWGVLRAEGRSIVAALMPLG